MDRVPELEIAAATASEEERSRDAYAFGQQRLGCCYYHGVGVKRDTRKAFLLYRRSASNGSTGAQRNVSYCYAKGLGVAKDMHEAIMCGLLYMTKGNEDMPWHLSDLLANTGL